MSFTDPVTIAGLTLSPLVAGAILLGVIVIACSITGYLRRRSRFNLEQRYSTLNTTWTNMIRATSNVDQALRSDRFGLVNCQAVFTGRSKDEIDEARKSWSYWSAQRVVAERTLKEAEELRTRFRARRWWQLSHKPLKTAIHKLTDTPLTIDSNCLSGGSLTNLAGLAPVSTINGTELSKDLEIVGSRNRSALERIQQHIRNAQAADKRVRDTVTGSAEDNLVALKNRLAATQELPFTPYEAKFGEVNASLDGFATQLKGDPLTDYASAENNLRTKITTLRNALLKALELFKELQSYRRRLVIQTARVDELRRTPLKPGYPDAIDSEVEAELFRFAEDDVELDAQLSSASADAERLTAHLCQGEAADFERVLPQAERFLSEAKRIVDEVVAAKKAVDDEMNAILDNSTKADLEADAADSQSISLLYAAQKWRAARVSVSALYGLHLQRVETRAAVDNLLQQQAVNELKLTRLSHIFSPGVDEFSATIAQEASRIKQTSQLGRTDWGSLMAQVAIVLDQVCGESDASLSKRIALEMLNNEKALAAVHLLTDKLGELQAKSGDGWGGAEAADLLANTAPSVKAVEEQSEVRKQDWVKLHLQAIGVREELRAAENLIATELRIDDEAFATLTRLEADIAACQNMAYKRDINGVDYGVGIYCHTTPAVKLLETAYAAYQQRHYLDAKSDADKGYVALLEEHLRSWWFCLQMMSMSGEAGARQYAHQNGYVDCGFEHWKLGRLAETAAPLGSNVPLAPASQRYNLPASLGAQGNKAAREAASELPGDTPSVTDYERRYAV